MNTKMLMLGILLIVGLSFAGPTIPDNWMTNSVNRYDCNYGYNDDGWEDIGLYDIAEDYDDVCDGGCWDFDAMDPYLVTMDSAVRGEYDMCYYSGCWCDEEDISATSFRSSMLEYNVASAGYKAEFLAGARAYLAHGGSRADILGDLQDARADYMGCLVYVAEEKGPCYGCPNY